MRKLSRHRIRQENFEFLVTLDETWLYLDDCNGQNPVCYLKEGKIRDNQQVIKQHELGGKKIMVIGILTGRGPIPLKFVGKNVKINSRYYCEEVLDPLVKKWLPLLYPEGLERIFIHHDAAPSHVSNYTTKFMEKLTESSKVTFISKEDIPVKSPDASPLDFFWFGYLKQKLGVRNPKTLDGLRRAASEVWREIDAKMILNVFDSWHRRLLQIEYREGNHIENTKKIHRKRLLQ